MCAHIWVLNTQSLQLWYSSLKKKSQWYFSTNYEEQEDFYDLYLIMCLTGLLCWFPVCGFVWMFSYMFCFFVFFSSMSCFDKFKMISSWGTLCWGFWRVCQDIHCHGGVCYVFFKWTQEQTLQETQLVCKSKRSFIRAEWRQTTRTLRRKTEDYS